MRNTLFPMALAGFFLLLVISMVTRPLEAFVPPLFDVRPTRATTPDATRLFMFDWINDAFGNKSKQEEQAAAKAKAEAEAQQKAEAEAAAAAAAAQKKQEEKALAEEQQRQRAEADAALVAKAKEEAEAKFAQFEAEQKAKAEAEEAERAAAKKQAEEEAAAEAAASEKAAAEAAAAEKAALEQAEADAVAAKVIAEAEAASQQTTPTETPPPSSPAKGDSLDKESIDQLIQEAVKTKSRVKGVVQWYNGGSGFGFIKPFQTPEEEGKLVQALRNDRLEKSMDKKSTTYSAGVFVHHSKIRAPDNTFFRKLYAVETVEMEIGFDGKGRPIATDVTGPGGEYVKAILKQESDRIHQAQ